VQERLCTDSNAITGNERRGYDMLCDFLKEQSSDVGCGGAGYPQKL